MSLQKDTLSQLQQQWLPVYELINKEFCEHIKRPNSLPEKNYWDFHLEKANIPQMIGLKLRDICGKVQIYFNRQKQKESFPTLRSNFEFLLKQNGYIQNGNVWLSKEESLKLEYDGSLSFSLVCPEKKADETYVQWQVKGLILLAQLLEKLYGVIPETKHHAPSDKPNTPSMENTESNDESMPPKKKDNEDIPPNLPRPTDKFVPIKYPITVKLNLSPNSINYPLELNNLKQFGDIQCRYMLNDREEMLCFVLQEVKKNEQCIFGIKKNILQKRISEQYFRLDDNRGNGVFLENAKDAIDALPLTYGMTSSWAVGPKTKNGIPVKASKKNYSKILHDWIQYERFTEDVVVNYNETAKMSQCECASLNDFNPSVVLLGQNWSDAILDVCHNNMRELWEVYWQNFQPGNAANGNGELLRDAIEGTILEKAYMTDFDKGNIETDSCKAFQKSMEREKINASILFNELQDLACLKKGSNISNIIICVWGTGQWDNVPNDIKYGKNKNWGKCEFRLVGEHYSKRNGGLKLRKQAVADFAASIAWQQAFFNAYNRKYGHNGVNNVLARHLCYIVGVIIHNEIYRESNDKGGFGGVGRKFGDGSVKKLYDETQKQTLAIDFKLPELSILTKYIKSKINKEIIECLCEPNPAERGKKAYDVLIKNNDSISKSISMFLESVSAFLDSELKTLLRTKLP